MKKLLSIAVICISLLTATGCANTDEGVFSVTDSTTTTKITTIATSTTTITETTPAEEEHSELFLAGVYVNSVIKYYNEVVLDGEYVHSGNASLVQKWTTPIIYSLNGATKSDRDIINYISEQFNDIEGFPGMYEAQDGFIPNLVVSFLPYDEMNEKNNTPEAKGSDGFATFYYDNNEIYDGFIYISSEMEGDMRRSVIMEEFYNILGPIQDTILRSDSIIYQYESTATDFTEMDILLLKLLYHPDIICGMNADECEKIIRGLYY